MSIIIDKRVAFNLVVGHSHRPNVIFILGLENLDNVYWENVVPSIFDMYTFLPHSECTYSPCKQNRRTLVFSLTMEK